MASLEFDDLLGGEEIENEDYTSPVELLGAVEDDMTDADFEDAVDETPELLGRAFGKLFSRLKYRRKLRRKFKKLPRSKRRKLIKKMMKKQRRMAAVGAAVPLLRMVPGSRIALAIMKRRARKRGLTLGQYLKKKRAKRRKKRKVRRVKRVARRSRRRSRRKKRVSKTVRPFSLAVTPSPVSTIVERPQMIEDIAEREEPSMIEEPAKKAGAAKLLPFAALAALPFILG